MLQMHSVDECLNRKMEKDGENDLFLFSETPQKKQKENLI